MPIKQPLNLGEQLSRYDPADWPTVGTRAPTVSGSSLSSTQTKQLVCIFPLGNSA